MQQPDRKEGQQTELATGWERPSWASRSGRPWRS